MLTTQQKNFSETVFNQLKKQFPEIKLVEITENPFQEKDKDVIIRLIPPQDFARRKKFSRLAAELTTDILMRHECDVVVSYVKEQH